MIKDNPPERVDVINTVKIDLIVHKTGFVPRPYQDEGIAKRHRTENIIG
jgi:hypothetical protein